MKNYTELKALSKDERAADLKESAALAIHMTEAKGLLKKHAAKTLTAMKLAGEITGDVSKHAKEITGHDIRETLQNVYEITVVFVAIAKGGIIDLTEEDFDRIGDSKLALLSPLLADDATDEMKAKLADAVKMLKGDEPASKIKELTRGTPQEPKKVREAKEAQAKAEASRDEAKEILKNVFENGTPVPVGFMATDIGRHDPLVNSGQFKARLNADFNRAIDQQDDTTLSKMIQTFGKAFSVACDAMEVDPLEFLAQLAAEAATPATGTTVEVEVPAIEVGAAA